VGIWTRSGNTFTLTGTGDTVFVANEPMGQPRKYAAQIRQRQDSVRIVLWASLDGRSRIEAGINPADVSQLCIRSVTFGGTPTLINPPAPVSHGIAASTPFTLEATVADGVVRLSVNGGSTLLTYTSPTTGVPRRDYQGFGFVSAVTGARVLRFEISDLVPATLDFQQAVIVAANGGLYLWRGGQSLQLLKSGVLTANGDVSMARHRQTIYAVDGTHAIKVDCSVEPPTVTDWAPSAGTLPGQTSAGTTTATTVYTAGTRVGLTRIPGDEANAYESAIDNPDDWNVNSDEVGRAFAFNIDLPGRIASPIVNIWEQGGGQRIIGCRGGIYRMTGDPALGLVQIAAATTRAGPSGPKAAVMIDTGAMMVHCPEGIWIVPVAGEARCLNDDDLTQPLGFPRNDAAIRNVRLARDSARRLVWVFLTNKATTTTTEAAYAYSERVGGFVGGAGGWCPQEWAASTGPTSVVEFDGRVILGTRTGRLAQFQDGTYTDFGQPYTSRFSVHHFAADPHHDVLIRRTYVTTGISSDPVSVKAYVGRSIADAYNDSLRRLAWSDTAIPQAPDRPISRAVRAPSVVIDLSVTGGLLVVDSVGVAVEVKKMPTRHTRLPKAAPPPVVSVAPPTVTVDSGPGSSAVSSGAAGTPGSDPSGTGVTVIQPSTKYVPDATEPQVPNP
jgi:hypothetical protein